MPGLEGRGQKQWKSLGSFSQVLRVGLMLLSAPLQSCSELTPRSLPGARPSLAAKLQLYKTIPSDRLPRGLNRCSPSSVRDLGELRSREASSRHHRFQSMRGSSCCPLGLFHMSGFCRNFPAKIATRYVYVAPPSSGWGVNSAGIFP